MGALFRLPLRGTEGFLRGLFKMAGLDLEVPEYTSLSRRGRKLSIQPLRRRKGEGLQVVIDSTGLKVYGGAAHGVCCCYYVAWSFPLYAICER